MKKTLIAFTVVVMIVALAGVLFLIDGTVPLSKVDQPQGKIVKNDNSIKKPDIKGVKQFASEEEFVSYISSVQRGYSMDLNTGIRQTLAAPQVSVEKSAQLGMADSAGASADERYSSTNVQVFGIDEPDIIKNDGSNIYLSEDWFPYYVRPLMDVRVDSGIRYPGYEVNREVKMIQAVPATDLKITKKFPTYGNLLLSGNILMTFQGNAVKAFDVNASNTEKELWKISYPERDVLVGARLFNGKLYLATKQGINYGRPCPYEPFVAAGDTKVIIPCTAIYHPSAPVSSDVLFTVSSFDVKTGKSEKNVSFLGSSSYSILYMSEESVYLTYFEQGDVVEFTYKFFKENRNLVSDEIFNRLEKLISYDLSSDAKQAEYYYLLTRLTGQMSDDDQLKFRNDFANQLEKYYPLHRREFDKTGIAKISLNDFSLKAVGEVPGQLLNQFSLDEYKNNLRVAVTVGQNWVYLGLQGTRTKSVNDVYVLNDKMEQVGSVLDMGEEERIYSARFIGDRGYVVTFRETDPFYVLDLSNPANPKLAGELKIPGYSSYLEPINEKTVLGIGKDGAQVKLSLFDVSNPANPTETSKFVLDEYWSEALNNHHAFLKDEKYKVFFIPGSSGGYVFSYENNKLELKKAVSEAGIKRAIYINDVLYIIGQYKISAWSEKDWTKLGELEIAQDVKYPGPIYY